MPINNPCESYRLSIHIVNPYEWYGLTIRMFQIFLIRTSFSPVMKNHWTSRYIARTSPATTNTHKMMLTEASYTKRVRFYIKKKKKKHCKNGKANPLFIIKNTNKDIFSILEISWLYEQKYLVPQTVPHVKPWSHHMCSRLLCK